MAPPCPPPLSLPWGRGVPQFYPRQTQWLYSDPKEGSLLFSFRGGAIGGGGGAQGGYRVGRTGEGILVGGKHIAIVWV